MKPALAGLDYFAEQPAFMNIAVNARHMRQDRLEGVGTVTHEVMSRIVRNHPQDHFDYYFDGSYHQDFIHGSNVTGHSFFPPTRLPFLIRYWMNHPVKKHLKKNKHNIFFSPDGFVPLGLTMPKVTVVHDIAFLRNPMHVTPRIRRFYETWMPQFIAESNHIITVSEFSKKELLLAYKLPKEKVSVVYNGVSPAYQPLPVEKTTQVREKYFDGHPYFLYLGAIHPRKNILTLVRAFEKFKFEFKSDFFLVIAGRPSWYTKEIFQAVAKSRWKNDIQMTGFIESETARKWMASAHALVYPSRYEGFGLPVVEAMASGTPVICSDVSSLPEVAGNAALFFEPGDVDALTQHLAHFAFNEEVREKYKALGTEHVKMFSWDKAADEVYGILEKFAT